jgi:CheY-like chemotaxis protein/anti-sigma regulatory factor (Ser/Thr protein kinase)
MVMATVLVVDDSVVDRHRAGSLLENPPGGTERGWGSQLTATYAADGREALATMQQALPDLVVADLRMPGMDGLELVETVKGRYPSLPVILMTAYGNEDIALLALQRGAAGYVPKRRLATDLLDTVASVLEMTQARRGHQRVLACLAETESTFVLENDESLLPHFIGHLRGLLGEMRLCDENQQLRICVALREALINAMHHGNLEVHSALLEKGDKSYMDLVAERRRQAPYKDRRVHVTVRQSASAAAYTIRDEGPGFDPGALPDPRDPDNLDKLSGRGLLLIRTFMDDVRHNATGNEIILVKRRK